MMLCKRRHADTPIRRYVNPLWESQATPLVYDIAFDKRRPLPDLALFRSGPNVSSAEFCDTDKAADPDLIWLLQLHKAGIGSATLRVIDRAVLPLAVTLLRQARYKNKPNNRKLPLRWIRIVDIGLLFSFSGRRLA